MTGRTGGVLPNNANAVRRTEYNELLKKFNIKAAKACSMIRSSVSPSFQQFVFGKSNPKDMWDTESEAGCGEKGTGARRAMRISSDKYNNASLQTKHVT